MEGMPNIRALQSGAFQSLPNWRPATGRCLNILSNAVLLPEMGFYQSFYTSASMGLYFWSITVIRFQWHYYWTNGPIIQRQSCLLRTAAHAASMGSLYQERKVRSQSKVLEPGFNICHFITQQVSNMKLSTDILLFQKIVICTAAQCQPWLRNCCCICGVRYQLLILATLITGERKNKRYTQGNIHISHY